MRGLSKFGFDKETFVDADAVEKRLNSSSNGSDGSGSDVRG